MAYFYNAMAMRWPVLRLLVLGILGAIAVTGCSSIQSFLSRTPVVPNEAILQMQVAPTAESGQYQVSGVADLPTGTELSLIAIRYLHLKQSPLGRDRLKPTYSILDYRTIEAEGGRWQTQLSLWKVAPDGQYKEAWQLQEPELRLAVEPEKDVLFLASLSPMDDLEEIERQLAGNSQRFASRFVRTTGEGSRYLRIGQMVSVNLPEGTTAPNPIREDDLNGGWGNRFLELPDPPNTIQYEFPDHRQTNAPLSSEEILY